MGLRGSKQKAEITAPPRPEKDKKVKRRKSKKDAAASNGGVGTEEAQNNTEEYTKSEEVKTSGTVAEESHESHEKDTKKMETSDDKKDVESSEKMTEPSSVTVPEVSESQIGSDKLEVSESQIGSDKLEEPSVKTEQLKATEPATVDENVPEKTQQTLESPASTEDKESEKPVVEVTTKLVSSTDESDVSTDKNIIASEEVPSATFGTTESLKESIVNSLDKPVDDVSTVKEQNEILEKPQTEEAENAHQTLEKVPVSQDNIEVTEESSEGNSTTIIIDSSGKNGITEENKEEIEDNPPGEAYEKIIEERVDENPPEEPREDLKEQSTDVSISEERDDGKEKKEQREELNAEEKETCEHKIDENGKPQSEIEEKEMHQEQTSEPDVENTENQPAFDREDQVAIKTTFPVVFIWDKEGKEVGVSGTFNEWSYPWALSESEGKFSLTRDLPEGEYLFKFVVDGNWIADVSQPTIQSEEHGQVNVMNVQPSIVRE